MVKPKRLSMGVMYLLLSNVHVIHVTHTWGAEGSTHYSHEGLISNLQSPDIESDTSDLLKTDCSILR